ncbi:MAG: acetolactate synthase small subunit [Lachnospiraceae bacterium]|uniref:Acetolactate synthase small subunit n=1 Tax=Candidatus Weimeria bifida TaxID=2599074 RepID=A0A6N7IWV9_9FIRM|nr:acetolactate synthase small subunit [Candidatus Weimeria bifida]RRF96268.1 MAG: acetolactate synthase small subunit [Lachnospiraceae bacterium]
MQKVLSILVENTPGLLSHVSGLFSRRGYNIDSFSSGVTADPRFTRITIVTHGDEMILEQIEKQVAKLCDVVDVKTLEPNDSVTRGLMLVKISARDTDRQSVLSICSIFNARCVDVTKDSMVLEVTGGADKLERFLNMLEDYDILELARTGLTGLARGTKNVVLIDEDGKKHSL